MWPLNLPDGEKAGQPWRTIVAISVALLAAAAVQDRGNEAPPPGLLLWESATAPEVPASPELIARGKAIYEVRCVTCRGKQGDGTRVVTIATEPPERPGAAERGTELYEKKYKWLDCHGARGHGDGERAAELKDPTPVVRYLGSSTIAHFIRDAEPVYGRVRFLIDTEPEKVGGEQAIRESCTRAARSCPPTPRFPCGSRRNPAVSVRSASPFSEPAAA